MSSEWLAQVRRSRFDLHAPIIPGVSAAGIFLGSQVNELLEDVSFNDFDTFSASHYRYRFGCVDVWAEDEVITQVGVSFGYWGRLSGTLTIDSRVEDIEASLGQIIPGEPGSFQVEGLDGFCFSIGSHSDVDLDDLRPEMRVSWLFVFQE